ncbi:signal peptidase II [Schlesneria paludicola]|uniref:signal peptidase II n=1 Tax=Schlesneria paludicola TaxID=360056 RepID=UPI00029A070C|nr:signal peptidase II [Schlesneria paludicola]
MIQAKGFSKLRSESGRMNTMFWNPRRLLLSAFILMSCVGCDQATKVIASQTLRDAAPMSFLSDTIRFQYALNPGGFLSLGHNLPDAIRPWLFVLTNVCLMVGILVFLTFRRTFDQRLYIAVLFILAGGIGNLIDRVSNHGLVTDFINLGIGPLRTGIFNVADMAVMFGGLAAVILTYGENESSDSPDAIVNVKPMDEPDGQP